MTKLCKYLSFVFIIQMQVSLGSENVIFVEAEGFNNKGGWKADGQFIDQMGSPYLLAHGLGRPVQDAETQVKFPETGKYHLWVRTKDWAPYSNGPGKFMLFIDGEPVTKVFGGDGNGKWHWSYGGEVNIGSNAVLLSVKDMTGFDGRLDAIIFSRDKNFNPPSDISKLSEFRKEALGLPQIPPDAGQFDLVVVGGGLAGECTAITASRLGLKTALIQNRPVLGGNNSSEVRVHLIGGVFQEPFPELGRVVMELDSQPPDLPPSKIPTNADIPEAYGDLRKLWVAKAEKNLKLFLNMHAFKVEKNGNKITAVIAKHTENSTELRFPASLFADCTGDGTIGYLAGADYRMGRESKSETGEESLMPEVADGNVMGCTILWRSDETKEPVSFPKCPWALDFNEQSCQKTIRGEWTWEVGGWVYNQIDQAEEIRDHFFRAIYGNWSFLVNESRDKAKYEKRELSWVGYVLGKQESRRLLGDIILKEQDYMNEKIYPDGCVPTTWPIELHYPDNNNSKYFPGKEFMVKCFWRFYGPAEETKKNVYFWQKVKPYPIPYRCFYSRNIANLFMAGRDISVTHVGTGPMRLMKTCGMMGEVVGRAAYLCKKYDTTPRGVYEKHLEKLLNLIKQERIEP